MIPRVIFSLCLLLTFTIHSSGQSFDRYFVERTLRLDYYHTGTKGTESFSVDQVYDEGSWAGSRRNLIDTLNLGEYQVRVYDQQSTALIYSRGYATIFAEWQTTDEALAGIYRTFHETILMPYPKQPVQVTINRRDKQMNFHQLFSTIIDPNSPTQINRERRAAPFKSITLMDNGPSSKKVDIVILGDGYRREDMEKFRLDARRLNDVLFATEPFKGRKKDFNVRAIEVISQDSGIDKPDKNIWKSTALGSRYHTFGSPRYVLTEDNRAWRDIAGSVPYDFVAILINDDRYGGGGIYNLYTTCYTRSDVAGMDWQIDYVYVHEFGHSFGGLADEYYSSQVSYNDMYQKGVEPWEPNITALVDKQNVKWKRFMAPGTPIPTPWNKERYDSLGREKGKLDRLAADYYLKREPIYQAERQLLKETKFAGQVGAFEGAGYISEGIYRPSADCRMFSLSLTDFDPVCTRAILRVIDFYSN